MEEKDYYFIEGVSQNDIIGFNSYLSAIKNAINNDAKFIGLLSDFGTGKSSLIRMLSEDLGNNYKVATINLWNCENDKKHDNDKIDIHSIFLHQLIDELKIKNMDYYKKKIDKNYSIFDIEFSYNNLFYFISLFVFYGMLIFEKVSLIDLFVCDLQKYLIFILISLLTVLCILIYKPLISFKRDDSSRSIDENDTKDLYQEIIGNYFSPRKNQNKKLIICLEELDRYDDPFIVIQHIKEIYKFYKLSNKQVIFIIAIKSAGMLCYNKENAELIDYIKNTYEKVFDFILNMNRINIQDFDNILLELLEEKSGNLPQGIIIPKRNLGAWRYLYYGQNITIRDIKHRYNFAISLYESVSESGIETVKFDKCLFIAYLEDEYNSLYTKLTTESDLLNNILVSYSKFKDIPDLFKLNSEEIDILLDGIRSKYIEMDYMYYFFKFPKNKRAFNIYELNLYNAIFLNNINSQLDISVENLSHVRIEQLLKKRVNPNFFPGVVFENKRLMETAYRSECDVFMNTIDEKYNLIKNFDRFSNLKIKIESLDKGLFQEIMKKYFQKKRDDIFELDNENRKELRLKLVKLFTNKVEIFKELFLGDNDILTKEEMFYIGDLSIIFEVTNFKKINESYIRECMKYNRYNSKTFIIRFLKTMSNIENVSKDWYKYIHNAINYSKYNLSDNEWKKLFNISKKKLELNNLNNLKKYINDTGHYDSFIDHKYLDMISSDNSKEIEEYISILKQYNFISVKGIDKIHECKTKIFRLNESMRKIMFDRGYYYYYVVSTKIDTNVLDVENDKLEQLKESYIKYFIDKKECNYNISENMQKLLYNNVNFDELNKEQLSVFVSMPQKIDIIKAVINTNDNNFINNYLKDINYFVKKDYDDIYKLLSIYYSNNQITKKAKTNLHRLAKTQIQKSVFDGRKNKSLIVK